MPALIGLLLLLGVAMAGMGGNLPFGEKLIPPTGPDAYAGAVCLDEATLNRNNVILTNIPKPNEQNLPFPNQGPCSGGGCQGPDFADYVLAAQNVKVEKIWPNPPTTRLFKQILPAEAAYDSLRDRVYRPSCNDWCLLGLPYGGTFHCDFIFFLHENESLEPREGELYPKDGALFDVLLRKEAPIPDKVKCDNITPTPAAFHPENLFAQAIGKAQAIGEKVFAQESFIDFAGSRWIYVEELTLIKYDVRTTADPAVDPQNGGRELLGQAFFRQQEYEVFKNLTNKIDLTEDFLYLVLPGEVEKAENQADPYYQFKYLEFRKSPEIKPRGFTLQLGSFKVPTGKGWWRKWVDESKPAIYLYPEEPTALRVRLKPAGELTVSDPPYNPETGWEVVAYPDGSLREYKSYESHRYLFYEAKLEKVFVQPRGFVVAGSELVSFFQKELPAWGLNEKETADFIEYWMSRLDERQAYYFIHFLNNEQIEKLEPLTIEECVKAPARQCFEVVPTTAIRLRTYFKPLKRPGELGLISLQTPPKIPRRQGFTLVEWGGILDQ